MNNYAAEVAAYTGGRGRLRLTVSGYDVCHNTEQVVAEFGYDPEGDLENTPDSVFCAHGGGFGVKWDKVPEYMHLESCIKKDKIPYEAAPNTRNFHIDDKELEAIMEREFGPAKLTQTLYCPKPTYKEEHGGAPENAERKNTSSSTATTAFLHGRSLNSLPRPIYPPPVTGLRISFATTPPLQAVRSCSSLTPIWWRAAAARISIITIYTSSIPRRGRRATYISSGSCPR